MHLQPDMISKLIISNYLLINSLEIQWDKGLNIITGETGAGKSILMGALELLTGERADLKVLAKTDQKCVIEGWFSVQNPTLARLLQNADLEPEPETIIRREILPGGKSRAFVNDSPVTLEILKNIGEILVDVHGQQETHLLAKTETQTETFDILSSAIPEKEAYQAAFNRWKDTRKKIADIEENLAKAQAELSYKQFVFNELEQANFQPGEQETLEKQLELLRHAEDIKTRLFQTLDWLDGEPNLISILKQSAQNLEKLSTFSTELQTLGERLQNIWLEAKDIVSEIKNVEDQVVHDPGQIQNLEERLSLIYNLQKKYRQANLDELLEFKKDMERQLSGFSHLEEDLEKMQIQLTVSETEMQEKGMLLRQKRIMNKDQVAQNLVALLIEMGLPKARFEISVTEQPASINGLDRITFLFSANPGLPMAELKNAASGGEFSRLMLAFKCLLAGKTAMPTLIFDEIDTGISGEVAAKVGKRMKEMARNHQILSITHSPQLAAQADAHWFVYKNLKNDSAHTSVRRLGDNERLEEIAKMISGASVSQAAMEAARHLVEG